MPSKHRIKTYAPQSYYHIFNRGTNKQTIFHDDKDYAVFLNLLKRYLDDAPTKDNSGREYLWLHNELQLLAFCLMPNHFHLLVYQATGDALTKLMRGVATSYTMYFNRRYKRTGPLFQDIFKAVRIENDGYWLHVSRYIHLNPDEYRAWPYSSLSYYLGEKYAGWINSSIIMEAFNGVEDYRQFLADYEGQRKIMQDLKRSLADN